MKVGFSFGRCLHDIVKGIVDIDDVMVIIGRTRMPDMESVRHVVAAYAGTYLHGLDIKACKAVAETLYLSGRLHQPRMFGEAERFGVHQDYIWMDLLPTVTDDNPAVKDAWDHYQMMLKLGSDTPLPDGTKAPKD